MASAPSERELLEIVHRFYPAGVQSDTPEYRELPEAQRLVAARRQAIEQRAAWDTFLARARASVPDAHIADWSFLLEAGHDACYQARITTAGTTPESPRLNEVVVLVSFLAPVYFIYTSVTTRHDGRGWRRSFPSWIQRTREVHGAVEEIVRGTLEAFPLAASVLFGSVPDVQCGNRWFGEVHLVDCLFSAHRW